VPTAAGWAEPGRSERGDDRGPVRSSSWPVSGEDRHRSKPAHRLVEPAEPAGSMYHPWNGLRRVADGVDGRHQPTDRDRRITV